MARYEPNIAATGRWLRSDTQLRNAVGDRADQIADRARVIAPVRTGEYKSKIRVDRRARGWDGRVAAEVEAVAAHSAAVEFGNAVTNGRGHHVLRRAAEGS